MTTVYWQGRSISLSPSDKIGEGGEAEIFRFEADKAIKLYKPASHPDFADNPQTRLAVEARLVELQKKLPAFPTGLPDHVVAPQGLITDRTKKIIGYVMPIISGAKELFFYGQKNFRHGLPNVTLVPIFRDLLHTVTALHEKHQVTIGDFNDLNVLVGRDEARLIDADSMQFKSFLCRTFTDIFVDPLLCDQRATSIMLGKPYTTDSDWYAFCVMLMRCFLFVGPYGGIYLPKNPSDKLTDAERVFKRVTVFHPNVRYPKPATPFNVLSDELLDHLEKVFVKDKRGLFPLALIENMVWQKCSNCGTEYARNVCPHCKQTPPAAVKVLVVVRGQVTATRIFATRGTIVRATVEDDALRYLYHEDKSFRREGGREVLAGPLDPHLRYRISGEATVLAKHGQMFVLKPGKNPEQLGTDSFNKLPVFDANANHLYWAEGGRLMQSGLWAANQIGQVVQNQSFFWVGKSFGLGFSRVSGMTIGFVFDAIKRGLNDTVKLPAIRGQLLDANCVFSGTRAWFTTTTRESGKNVIRLTVVTDNGTVEATLESDEHKEPWLSGIHGATAAGPHLFVPTDDGIVRVEAQNQTLVKTRVFPDTEPFVDSHTRLLPAQNGLYAVGVREITHLTIR